MKSMELPSHFAKFLSNIEPTYSQKSEASTGHNTLRSRLKDDKDFKSIFKDSFLSGSYGRDTAIRPINDVDIIIITIFTEKLDPNTALFVVERSLKNYYPSEKIKRQGRSVRVTLSYVTMDIVPSITTNNIYDTLKIPDREIKEWVLTNPRKHIELSTDINKRRSNLYKPLVKSLKEWRDYRMSEKWKPKSFLLECLVYNYALVNNFTYISKAIEDFFWFTHQKYDEHKKSKSYSPVIPDPAGTGIDVAKRWSYSDFCKFMDEVFSSWFISYNALNSTGYNESVEKWRRVLGPKFPQKV